jgi:predicted Zn-ribbon and HTH transcriptional regulator
VKCDLTKSVDYEVNNDGNKILPQEILCRKCGSEMKGDISPMCPYCRSRVNEVKETLILYD